MWTCYLIIRGSVGYASVHTHLGRNGSRRGTLYAQQSYKVNDAFPSKWIDEKLIECFYVTSMVTAGSRLAVFMYRYPIFIDYEANTRMDSL
ncbi:casein kinase 1-like protein HD16 [Triticum aestivum]|uniref:casein kinase 1-like protein HD16 n=1 Tax=Triticum aestivum TaxID=4565 RepID=UPI001D028E73|nr:casein kinase 1-like protein HD16 [Triticum aestivum]